MLKLMLGHLAKTLNRHQWIAEAAYYIAEAQGFRPELALENWLAAETAYADMLITAYIKALDEDGSMTLSSLRQLAELVGVEDAGQHYSEFELIHHIQIATQHRPCFRADSPYNCRQPQCQWRTECQKLISVWHAEHTAMHCQY
ncbi:MAG: DUF2934 domain-containing protein [Methylococcaceae bacterium]|jgi:hypothetical protein